MTPTREEIHEEDLTSSQYEYIGRFLAKQLRGGATIKGGKNCLRFISKSEIYSGLEIDYSGVDTNQNYVEII